MPFHEGIAFKVVQEVPEVQQCDNDRVSSDQPLPVRPLANCAVLILMFILMQSLYKNAFLSVSTTDRYDVFAGPADSECKTARFGNYRGRR